MEIHERLGYMLGTSSKLIKRTMDNSLSKYNITTSQWAVMKLLDHESKLSQSQIAYKLLADKATIGEIILRLNEKNFIEKTLGENDKRLYVISLTSKAKEIVKDIELMANEVTEIALQGLAETDQQRLYLYLSQIIENLLKEEIL